MKRTLAGVLCLLMVLSLGSGVWAAEEMFGEDVTPLTDEELSEVDGEFKSILFGAACGAVFNTTSYLITTPSSKWNLKDGARHALAGAITGAAATAVKF